MISSRRSLLAGTAAGALGGALSGIVRMGRAEAQGFPTRLLVWAHMEGNISAAQRPSGTETDFTLSTVLSPLERWKDRMIVVDGLNTSATKSGVDPHFLAASGMLTGGAWSESKPGVDPAQTISMPSIDQVLARHLKGGSRLASVEITVGAANATTPHCVYPIGGGPKMKFIETPESLWTRLFGGPVGNTPEALRARRRSTTTIQYLQREIEAVRQAAGRDGTMKLQQQLTALEDIQKEIDASAKLTSCTSAPGKPVQGARERANIPAWTKMQSDLMVAAMACDITRVATYASCDTGWTVEAPWLFPGIAHVQSHTSGSPWPTNGPKLFRWVNEQLGYIMAKMASIPEGNGTMLDNTFILSIGEFGNSSGHSDKTIPVVLFPNKGNPMKAGRFVTRYAGRSNNDLLAAICRSLGLEVNVFGDPRWFTSPLALT
jgi:hypothetical protein